MRDGDEAVIRRPLRADDPLQHRGDPVGCHDCEQHEHERLWAAPDEREHEADRNPYGAVASNPRQPDEDLVQRVPAVLDDPPLEVPIEPGQVGTIDFVWSMSCCRSKGFPTKACTPLADACASVFSSTLPLNITTGIAPAPYCS